MRNLILTMLVATAFAAPAHAQTTDAVCGWTDGANVFTAQGMPFTGQTVRICRGPEGEVRHARLYSAPRHNGFGLCSVTTQDITLEPRSNGRFIEPQNDPQRGWGPYLRAQMHDDPCPAAGEDDGYVASDGVPDGVFATLGGMWQAMRAEPSLVAHMLAPLYARNGEREPEELDRDARGLAEDMADPRTASRLVLTAIVSAPDTYPDGGRDHTRSQTFKLIVHMKGDWREWREIEIDWTGQGWRIVRIAFVSE